MQCIYDKIKSDMLLKKYDFHMENRKCLDCFVSYKNNLIYINVHKNGSSTIRKLIDDFKYENYNNIKNKNKFKKLFVVRNIFDRIISSYFEMKKLRTDIKGTKYTIFMEWIKIKDLKLSFSKFIDELEKYGFYDIHCSSQIQFLNDKNLSYEEIDLINFDILEESLKNYFDKNNIKINNIEIENSSNIINKNILKDYINGNNILKNKIINLYLNDHNLYLNSYK